VALVVMFLFAGVVVPRSHTVASAQAVDPATVLTQAREALGGDARINAVKTLIVTGRTRQVRGDNLVPIEFEIQIELPDKYARRDEIPAQDTGPTVTGFNGEELIQIPKPLPPPARPRGPPPPTPAQQEAALRARTIAVKQDFARLMLGMFASSSSAVPLTFTYVGRAEAPQGAAQVIEAKGPANFAARLFVDAATHVPIMVSWQQVAPPAGRGGPGRGAPGRGDAAPGHVARGGTPTPPAPVEHRLYFADYRDVDGLKLPFRLRHAVAGDTIEETTFDRFRINARVDPRRFDASN